MATEKRLIDANELLRIYKKWIPKLALPEDEGDKRGVENCIAVLEDAPTVDAVEVVHGRWIGGYTGTEYRIPKCSQCGYGNGAVGAANYCPNCGTKMDGDGNG